MTNAPSSDAMHDHGIRKPDRKPEESQGKASVSGDCDTQPPPTRTGGQNHQELQPTETVPPARLREAVEAYVTGQGWRLNSTNSDAAVFPTLYAMEVSPAEACAAIKYARTLNSDRRKVYWVRDLTNDVKTYRNRNQKEEPYDYGSIHNTDRNGLATSSPDYRRGENEPCSTPEERKRQIREQFERKQSSRC
jgi:hypothetical protein